jgi:hypothetical protein
MFKLGTQITTPDGNGSVQRNSIKTGALMVRVNDRWYAASECKRA